MSKDIFDSNPNNSTWKNKIGGLSTKKAIFFTQNGIRFGANNEEGKIRLLDMCDPIELDDFKPYNLSLYLAGIGTLLLILLNFTAKTTVFIGPSVSWILYIWWIHFQEKDFIEQCIWQLFNINDYRQISRNHSAEHMTANAYESLGRVPKDIEEIQKFSKIHERCGSISHYRNIVRHLPYAIGLYFCTYNILFGIAIMILLVCSLAYLDIKYNVLKYLEIITLRKPKDENLELALAAIKHYDESINKLPEEGILPIVFPIFGGFVIISKKI